MKTIKYYFICTITIIVAFCLKGCSDDKNNYLPGPEVLPTAAKVYFNESNGSIGNVELDEEYLNIAVSRVNTSGSLTVPIIVSWSSEGLSFPDQSVTFNSGEETAYFRVKYASDLEYETLYPFKLELDHAYTDPYDESIPGTVTYKGNLNRIEPWAFVADMTCTFEALSGSKPATFDSFKQKLYKKEKAGIFKIENWCLNNTGEWYGDLIFKVDEKKRIHPDESIGYHGYAGRWYFYVPWATSDDTEFEINGHLPTSTGVYMTYFYLYKVGSTDSAYAMDFDEEAKTATIGGYSRYSKSTFSSGRFQIHYTW